MPQVAGFGQECGDFRAKIRLSAFRKKFNGVDSDTPKEGAVNNVNKHSQRFSCVNRLNIFDLVLATRCAQ
jgi:hypothetical protein